MATSVIVLNLISLLISVTAIILDIVHNSDLHSSFDPTCTSIHECYGSISQHASEIEFIRETIDKDPNENRYLLYLNVGDSSNGSLLYTLFRNELLAKILNHLKPNVMTLGDADFIVGTKELKELLENLNKKINVVSSNLDFPKKTGLNKLVKKHAHFKFGSDFRVGVVAYITKKTADYLDLGDIAILDELQSVKESVKILKDEHNCNYIIALSHSNHEKDVEIAYELLDVDLIVGGHIHKKPDVDTEFPLKIFRKNTNVFALISRTYEKNRFIGHLTLVFKNNRLVSYEGERKVVDKVYSEDKKMEAILEKYTRKMIDMDEKQSLKTQMEISGNVEECKTNECEIGGMVADAFITYFSEKLKIKDIDGAILDVSQFHHDLDTKLTSMVRVARCLPYLNKIFLIKTSGKTIRKLFKMAALKYYDWHFLQVSNSIQVLYERTNLALSLLAITVNGMKLEPEQEYRILIMRHLMFDQVLSKNRNDTEILETSDKFDHEIVWWYIKHGTGELVQHNITGDYTYQRLIISKSIRKSLIFQIFFMSIIVAAIFQNL